MSVLGMLRCAVLRWVGATAGCGEQEQASTSVLGHTKSLEPWLLRAGVPSPGRLVLARCPLRIVGAASLVRLQVRQPCCLRHDEAGGHQALDRAGACGLTIPPPPTPSH